ncbi:MAG: hypothetical protein IAE83_10065 [Anaerolinea sp.]|nr:hypothetical protein [Anaerolinea sp.]CAG0998374.1 hypothetical protein ANRL4_02944 [Anaerolineae bacterium]
MPETTGTDKLSQLGIMIILLGGVITMIGFFPGVIGAESAGGIGVLQTLAILSGFAILIGGAFVFLRSSYYPSSKHTLAQRIAARLSMTGIVFSTASGLADVLGFGSHPPIPPIQRPMLGSTQMVGLFLGFAIASAGVVIYALMGDHHPSEPEI